jgi:hypothetical protein
LFLSLFHAKPLRNKYLRGHEATDTNNVILGNRRWNWDSYPQVFPVGSYFPKLLTLRDGRSSC